jgi:hypothetical protein
MIEQEEDWIILFQDKNVVTAYQQGQTMIKALQMWITTPSNI